MADITAELAARLERVEAELALHRLVNQYCIAADGGDLDLWASILPPEAQTSSRSSRSIRGQPGDRRRCVHFLATSSRCQRSSVCGETGNTDHRSRGSSVLAAASSRRLRRCYGVRLSVRRSTASSCRSTAFSTSSAAADEPPPNTRRSLRTARYISKKSTGGSYGPLTLDANHDFCALHAPVRPLCLEPARPRNHLASAAGDCSLGGGRCRDCLGSDLLVPSADRVA